jgi:hypothetical protein
MPIIYSYPSKTSPASGDLLLISDVSASNQTKKITIGDLKDPLDVVDSLTATLPIEVSASTGDVTISSRAYGGGFTTGHVPSGGNSINFLRGDGTWNVLVNSITMSTKILPTDIAYLGGVDLSGAVGNVNLGTLNLNASDFGGTPPNPGLVNCSFLIKDNYWANLWPAQVNFLGGIQLSSATVQTVAPNAVSSTASKTYSVQLDSNNKAVVNVPWLTEITLTTTGTSGAASWNGTTLNIPQYSGSGNVGFSPMSIYEGEVEVGTVSLGGNASFARQTTVENSCTINKVQFFRMTGTNEISIYVYEGLMTNPGAAALVLAGTMAQGAGTANSMNELSFNKSGYTSHTFGAGTAIIIVVGFRSGDGGANALGNDTLQRTVGLSASGNYYIDQSSVPLTYDGLEGELGEGNQYGVSMHFFNKP